MEKAMMKRKAIGAGLIPLLCLPLFLLFCVVAVETAQDNPQAPPAQGRGGGGRGRGAAAPAAPIVGYTSEQAERGRVLYDSNCSGCHGINLDGGTDAPPLTGVNWNAFRGSGSVNDLVQYIMSAMPPTSPGSLGEESTGDVVTYIIQRMGAGPTGTTPLPPNSPVALNRVGRAGGGGRGRGGDDDAVGGGAGGGAAAAFGAGTTAGPGHGGALGLMGVSVRGEVKNFRPVTFDMLKNPSPNDWLIYRGNYQGW